MHIMKTKILLLGLLALALVLAGCITEQTIRFGEPTQFRSGETKLLEDYSVSLKLTRIGCGAGGPNTGVCAPEARNLAHFLVKNISTGEEKEFSARIRSSETEIGLLPEKIPFVDYSITVWRTEQSNSASVFVWKEDQNQTQWLSYQPIQCNQNPWEKWIEADTQFCNGKSDGTRFDSLDQCNQCTCQNGKAVCTRRACVLPTNERKQIENYYRSLYGIEILNFKRIPPTPGLDMCTACNCLRGDTINVLVKESDVPKMLELGWKRIETTAAVKLSTTKPYFINGETVQLKLQNDSDKTITFFRGLDGKTIQACGAANATVFKKTNKFEQFSHYKPIACMPVPSIEKLGPGQETLLEWKYPQIFRENGEELPLLGEYKIVISYSENENGSNPIETQSNEFLISKGLFMQYTWKSGDLTETMTKLEDRVLLESARGKAMPQTFSLPISETEQKEWQDALVGSGLFTVKQSDLKPNNFVQEMPEKTFLMRYNDLQTDLKWNALEEEPIALAYAVNKLNETRKQFDRLIPASTEWLFYSPIQCGNNPWEQWHNDLNRQYFRAPTEQEIVTEYLQTVLNVNIVDYRRVPAMPGTAVCTACNCARGDSIQILVNKSDENKTESAGWKKEFEDLGNAKGCNWTPGPCLALIQNGYAFNPQTGNCDYISGGSGCSNPPFKTRQECKTVCGPYPIEMPDPASVYCKQEGGTLEANGDCKFGPTICPEWDFYRGKCGQSLTSCAKTGFEVKNIQGTAYGYQYEYGLCMVNDTNCLLEEFRNGNCEGPPYP